MRHAHSVPGRVAIFDFDGTIANTFPLVLQILREHRASRGQTGPDDEEIEALRAVDSREIFQHLGIPKWKIPLLIAVVRHKLRRVEHELQSFNGIPGALQKLVDDGWRLLVLSSNQGETIRRFFERRSLPAPERIEAGVKFFGKERRLRRLLGDLRIDPANVVIVGDETRDLFVGRACGTRTVGVSWGLNLRRVLESASPDVVIDCPSEIPRVLERLLPAFDGARR